MNQHFWAQCMYNTINVNVFCQIILHIQSNCDELLSINIFWAQKCWFIELNLMIGLDVLWIVYKALTW